MMMAVSPCVAAAALINWEFDDLRTFLRELGAELASGGVFDRGGDDALARRAGGEQAADGGVDGLGAAAGEEDLGLGAADELRDLAARVLEELAGALARAVDAGGVAVAFTQAGDHRLDHFGRGPCRRVVVQVSLVHGCDRLYALLRDPRRVEG